MQIFPDTVTIKSYMVIHDATYHKDLRNEEQDYYTTQNNVQRVHTETFLLPN